MITSFIITFLSYIHWMFHFPIKNIDEAKKTPITYTIVLCKIWNIPNSRLLTVGLTTWDANQKNPKLMIEVKIKMYVNRLREIVKSYYPTKGYYYHYLYYSGISPELMGYGNLSQALRCIWLTEKTRSYKMLCTGITWCLEADKSETLQCILWLT